MEGHPAVEGDLVVMDFVGKVDGVPFEGGTGEGMSIELGSGRLIPASRSSWRASRPARAACST
jgi:trigger factor